MLTKLGKALLPLFLSGTVTSGNAFFLTMGGLDLNKVVVLGKTLRTSLSSYNGISAPIDSSHGLMKNPDRRFTSYSDIGNVLFGSGSTPPTENDTDVESLITGITASYSSRTNPPVLVDGEKVYRYLDYTITNNGSSSITIREVCFYLVVLAGGSAIGDTISRQSSNYGNILFSRSLLDNPVTIAAGESGIVRVKFELN